MPIARLPVEQLLEVHNDFVNRHIDWDTADELAEAALENATIGEQELDGTYKFAFCLKPDALLGNKITASPGQYQVTIDPYLSIDPEEFYVAYVRRVEIEDFEREDGVVLITTGRIYSLENRYNVIGSSDPEQIANSSINIKISALQSAIGEPYTGTFRPRLRSRFLYI